MKRFAVLFCELFRISLFVVGGGYAIIAVADAVFARRKWTREGELIDRLPVFQMVPGLIATHTAVYVGRKVAGWRGAVVGVIAVALPSVVIFTCIAAGYGSLPLANPWLDSAFVGLRSALTGIIAAAVVRSWTRSLTDAFTYALMASALAALALGVSVPFVLLGAMLAGTASALPTGTFRASWLPLLVFLRYGALCFGGGFVLVPMYIEDFVGPTAAYLNLPAEEFSNLMALTQMTPGPIGINGATYFGYRLASVTGAVLASLALLLPGSLLAFFAFASLERFRANRWVRGLLRGAGSASLALMLVALAAFASMSVVSDGKFNTTALVIAIISLIMTLKKKLNVVVLVIVSALVATALRAETEICGEEITLERYPDADVVLVNDSSCVKYHADGTSEETSESWTKILTEKGRREESTFSLSYSKRYGEAEILYVGAIGEDGVEREIDVSATTSESTDNSSMGVNIYDPLDRRIVCTIPGLRIGETLHMKIRRATLRPRCENVWADTSVFEWTCPIVRSSVEITAPKERPLKRIAIRNPLGNVVQSSRVLADGSTVHSFVCTNSPQAFAEPSMPPMLNQMQHLRVSTAEDWPEISRWYWNLCQPHLAKVTDAMKAKVAELVSGCATDAERLRAVFKFVSQEVRYMGLTMEDTSPGYSPHDIDITFDNRYGVCRDKAALLVALLRLAGFESYPVLIHVAGKHDDEVPQPFFNHAVVAVSDASAADGYTLLDPTSENAKDLLPSFESDKSYLVCRPEGEKLLTTQIPPPDHNALRVASRARLGQDGSLFLVNDIRFGGVNDSIYRESLVKKTPEDRVKFFERVVRALASGAELIKCEVEPSDMRDTETPVRVVLTSKLPEMLLRGETRSELTVPYISGTIGLANFLLDGNTALEKRRFPLALDSTACVDETLDLELDGAPGPVKELPDDERLGVGCGYEFTRLFTVTNGLLRSHRRLALSRLEFSPEEYVRLREDMKRTEAAERRRPVFAEDRLADADVRWLDESSEIDVFSDRAWVITNRIEKEILTYKGKKSSAELKFSYNPAVDAVELVSAVVSNRDGSVSRVSDHEINVMDCGWAAAAPRYPASKLLVVNLPSVEIGSVISYTTVRTVTNAPASFYGSFGFDSQEPLDRRYVRVNGWSREVKLPRRIPDEPGQPVGELWRDRVAVSSNRLETAAAGLAVASDLAPVDPCEALGFDRSECGDEADVIKALRDWMARNVRIAGPSYWEVPLALQLTDPETVLKERYATRLDYVRTLCALLRGAGCRADVVLAADDAADPQRLKDRFMREHLRLTAFAWPLCRVRVTKGGFLGFGGEVTTYFLGAENEYTPLGVSSMVGCDFIDPETGGFGVVTVPGEEFLDASEVKTEIDVAENGTVDMAIEMKLYGLDVGAFRRQYAEILPEDRSRLHQSLLARVAQAATAKGELETDIVSYPAVRRFACSVPDYATVDGDTLTLQLPPLASTIPTFTGKVRKTPFAVAATDRETETVTVRLPAGYTEIEHLPAEFRFGNPYDQEYLWLRSKVTTARVGDHLEVTVCREIPRRGYTWFMPDFIELVKDRSRIASSRANRTIVVRKAAE